MAIPRIGRGRHNKQAVDIAEPAKVGLVGKLRLFLSMIISGLGKKYIKGGW